MIGPHLLLARVDNHHLSDKIAAWIIRLALQRGQPSPPESAGPAFAKDPSSRSPSQVLKLTMDSGEPKTAEVYLNNGDPLSGSSVAARWRDRLLIGTVYDPAFLDCRLP